ncbi:MAG: formylglycine-generating enzyme family protein [Ekhidna sp.]
MRIILLLALLSFSLVHAQVKDPFNGVFLKDNLYMDVTEVANIHWLEYEFYLKKDSLEEFVISSLPSEEITKNYRPEYFRHPNYRYHPVVGISYTQALNYCKWRTAVVNFKLEADRDNRRVKYRLPTEVEWELAAKSIDTLEMERFKYSGLDFSQKKNRKFIREIFPEREINFKELKKEISAHEKENVPRFVVDFEKPWFVLQEERLPKFIYEYAESQSTNEYQHIIGNVAEMVLEKGVAKGGSWRQVLPTSFPSKRQKIDPEKGYDWVGFRCIAEVYELDDPESKKP